MQNEIVFVPQPKKVVYQNGFLPFEGFVLAQRKVFAGHTLAGLQPFIAANGVTLAAQQNAALGAQAYVITVDKTGVTVQYATQTGLHYAVLTLLQAAKQCKGKLPFMCVHDEPDFVSRGFMLDISRNKVPTLATLKKLVDYLSDVKVNMLQLYVEGRSFYYPSKAECYSRPDDYLTSADIVALKKYAEQRFVSLVPCGNCYGHMTYWLNQPQYNRLAYSPNGFDWSKDGLHCPAGTLNPADPDSVRFVRGLFDDMLPAFGNAGLFNIGGDEPFDTIYGEHALDDDGETYFSYMQQICADVRSRGLTPMMWGDVAHNHPDKIDRLGDVVYLEWHYDKGLFNDECCRLYAQKGARFYVCPSSGLYSSVTGKTDNMLANIAEAAHYGKKYGAEGMLNTDWGDGASSQTFVSSVYCQGVAACYSWNATCFDDGELQQWLNDNVYGCNLSAIVTDLGRYVNLQKQKMNMIPFLFSALYIRGLDCMQVDYDNYSDPLAFFRRDELLTTDESNDTQAFLDDIRARLDSVDNGNLYCAEARYALDMLTWAVMHTRVCRGLRNDNPDVGLVRQTADFGEKCVLQHKQVWFARNKRSDYAKAAFRWTRLAKKYRQLLSELTAKRK